MPPKGISTVQRGLSVDVEIVMAWRSPPRPVPAMGMPVLDPRQRIHARHRLMCPDRGSPATSQIALPRTGGWGSGADKKTSCVSGTQEVLIREPYGSRWQAGPPIRGGRADGAARPQGDLLPSWSTEST